MLHGHITSSSTSAALKQRTHLQSVFPSIGSQSQQRTSHAMLGRAGALARRTVGGHAAQLPTAGMHAQLACAPLAGQGSLLDYCATPSSMRMSSGGNSALTTISARSSLTATARSLLVDTLDMVGAWFPFPTTVHGQRATAFARQNHCVDAGPTDVRM